MHFNEWITISIIFVALIITYLLGCYLGNINNPKKEKDHANRISNIQAGLMGVLGVMLAFSFSLSSQRFELKRQLIIQESLHIGTTYFRAGLLPDKLRQDLRNLLEAYLDERIKYYTDGNSESEMERIHQKSEEIQVRIWAKTAEMSRDTPNLNTNVTILSLNSMIDVSGNIMATFQSHVPKFIIILLSFITMCTILIMGYSHGLHSDKNIFLMIVLNMVLCSILFLIIDLDSPTTGFLKTDTYSLVALKNEIQKYKR